VLEELSASVRPRLFWSFRGRRCTRGPPLWPSPGAARPGSGSAQASISASAKTGSALLLTRSDASSRPLLRGSCFSVLLPDLLLGAAAALMQWLLVLMVWGCFGLLQALVVASFERYHRPSMALQQNIICFTEH
jgi:hypothetical protein